MVMLSVLGNCVISFFLVFLFLLSVFRCVIMLGRLLVLVGVVGVVGVCIIVVIVIMVGVVIGVIVVVVGMCKGVVCWVVIVCVKLCLFWCLVVLVRWVCCMKLWKVLFRCCLDVLWVLLCIIIFCCSVVRLVWVVLVMW